MKKNDWLLLFGVLLLFLNFTGINFQPEFRHFITFPYQQIGIMLQHLSLSSLLLNMVAWTLYVLISLLPIVFVWFFKKRRSSHDYLLIVYSLLSIFIYFWINPGYVAPALGLQNSQYFSHLLFAIILHLLLGAYVFYKVSKHIKKNDNFDLLTFGKQSLFFLQAIIIYIVFGIQMSELIYDFNLIYLSNQNELFLIILKAIVNAIPYLSILFLNNQFMKFIDSHQQDPYSQNNVETLTKLASTSKHMLLISLGVLIAFQALVLLIPLPNQAASYPFHVPVLAMALMVLILLTKEIYLSTKKLVNENQGFI